MVAQVAKPGSCIANRAVTKIVQPRAFHGCPAETAARHRENFTRWDTLIRSRQRRIPLYPDDGVIQPLIFGNRLQTFINAKLKFMSRNRIHFRNALNNATKFIFTHQSWEPGFPSLRVKSSFVIPHSPPVDIGKADQIGPPRVRQVKNGATLPAGYPVDSVYLSIRLAAKPRARGDKTAVPGYCLPVPQARTE